MTTFLRWSCETSRSAERRITDGLVDKADAMAIRVRLWLLRNLGSVTRYQPNPFAAGGQRQKALRACFDRYEAFAHFLPMDEPLSTLDIGCHSGYFTFRMAERGGLCLGIERGRREVEIACSLAALHAVENVAFSRVQVDAKTVAGMPKADVVLCLSLFHHWVREFGADGAVNLLRETSSRACRFLVFETGQPNEFDMKWAKELEFMGRDADDVRNWVRSTLTEMGFPVIHDAGMHASGVSRERRALFVADRRPARAVVSREPGR